MTTQKLRITGVLELETRFFPPDDSESQEWLIWDILLGEGSQLLLHSNEIGVVLGPMYVETVEEVGNE